MFTPRSSPNIKSVRSSPSSSFPCIDVYVLSSFKFNSVTLRPHWIVTQLSTTLSSTTHVSFGSSFGLHHMLPVFMAQAKRRKAV